MEPMAMPDFEEPLRAHMKEMMRQGSATIEGQRSVPPTFAFCAGKTVDTFESGWNSERDRSISLGVAKALGVAKDADWFAVMSEVWTTSASTKDEALRVPPSESPDRTEALFVFGSYRKADDTLGHVALNRAFSRYQDGFAFFREEPVSLNDDRIGGDFVRILLPSRPDASKRAIARDILFVAERKFSLRTTFKP
jgi:hypothetical protein